MAKYASKGTKTKQKKTWKQNLLVWKQSQEDEARFSHFVGVIRDRPNFS